MVTLVGLLTGELCELVTVYFKGSVEELSLIPEIHGSYSSSVDNTGVIGTSYNPCRY